MGNAVSDIRWSIILYSTKSTQLKIVLFLNIATVYNQIIVTEDFIKVVSNLPRINSQIIVCF